MDWAAAVAADVLPVVAYEYAAASAAASATFCWSRRWTKVEPPSRTSPVIATIAISARAKITRTWPLSRRRRPREVVGRVRFIASTSWSLIRCGHLDVGRGRKVLRSDHRKD